MIYGGKLSFTSASPRPPVTSSAEEEKRELDVEIGNKKATRDKVKAEVASRLEAVTTSCSKVDDIDRENKSLLARAKRVEGEIDEIREAQEEMQEMAVGLQRKNAILRHELRYLKRELEGDNPGQPHMLSSRDQGCNSNNISAHGIGNGSQRSSSTSRAGGNFHQGNGGGGKQGSQFYHHSAAPQHGEGRQDSIHTP
ncbi:unnamed protein product [Ectocarpus sp. CCAP 1310/34]|nr:unnamed protein product [Ectocarpus sp. CCAP 1310/34]